MKNKILLKKYLKIASIVLILFIIFFGLINCLEYHIYVRNFNNKIVSITSVIKEEYPDISEDEIIEILNSKNSNSDIFKKYSIDINTDSLVKENNKYYNIFLISNIVFVCGIFLITTFIFLKYNHKKDKKIKQITKYMKELNKRNYTLQIDTMSEDELSILKNEIYKTTITLKEQAENSYQDKLKIKDALSDISHQLKTPLTGILIMIDNILEDENMKVSTRQDFIKDIKREIVNINFLVQSILTLSRIDANAIKFSRKKVKIINLLNETIKKVNVLCDLKNINIILKCKNEDIIKVDFNWQIEALTNILKNCIEHSSNNSNIEIEEKQNNIYTEIVIRDYGTGIDKEDLPHIFERFYKGKNSNNNSIGIGLALSKTIIEANNGSISVKSKIKEGTTFTIKYFQI